MTKTPISPEKARTRVFVSFDYDNDADLKAMLIGQSKHQGTPFSVADWSIKQASPDWQAQARKRISAVDQVIVVCGRQTHKAKGVEIEVLIARELGKPYFLLAGRKGGGNRRPRGTWWFDSMYPWTWTNLEKLLAGKRPFVW